MTPFLNSTDPSTRRAYMSHAARSLLGVSVLPAFAAAQGKTPGTRASARNVIYLNLSGGMSHIDTFDPKPGNPTIQGPVQIIKTNTGERISGWLPGVARQMDKIVTSPSGRPFTVTHKGKPVRALFG